MNNEAEQRPTFELRKFSELEVGDKLVIADRAGMGVRTDVSDPMSDDKVTAGVTPLEKTGASTAVSPDKFSGVRWEQINNDAEVCAVIA